MMKVLALAGVIVTIAAAAAADPIIIRGVGDASVTKSAPSTNNPTGSMTNSTPILLGTNVAPSGSPAINTNRPSGNWKEVPANVTNMPSITNPPSRHIEPKD
jgi:hypothetical protein